MVDMMACAKGGINFIFVLCLALQIREIVTKSKDWTADLSGWLLAFGVVCHCVLSIIDGNTGLWNKIVLGIVASSLLRHSYHLIRFLRNRSR